MKDTTSTTRVRVLLVILPLVNE